MLNSEVNRRNSDLQPACMKVTFNILNLVIEIISLDSYSISSGWKYLNTATTDRRRNRILPSKCYKIHNKNIS